MPESCMLTTIDNPFNPFESFIDWFMFDIEKGYNCCGYLDRVANFTDTMSEEESAAENERAIDEIVALNPTGMYAKVYAKQ